MSAPIKATIVSALRALSRLRTPKDLQEEISEEDNLEIQFLKMQALTEKIETEVTTGDTYLNDIRSAMAQYVDLLRKLSGDERKQANEDFEKFQVEQKLDRAMETIELMLRNLRDHQSSTAIKTKLLESRVEKEKRSEEIIHAQLLQASAPKESSSTGATRQTISSIYQLPTLQIKRFNGERKDWLEFYESFRCAVDSSAGRQARPNQQNHQKSPQQHRQNEYTYAAITQGQRLATQRNQNQSNSQATQRENNQWGFNNTRRQVNNRALLPDCTFCGLTHWNDKCNKYDNAKARLQIAKEKKLCTRCLRRNHSNAECKTPAKCYHCGRLHPTALCKEMWSDRSNKETDQALQIVR
uniref:Uncharacterized protein n=1 Tax=Meloidogyne floridensis TaxID=298350 RepID=A0A915NDA2_9BILA